MNFLVGDPGPGEYGLPCRIISSMILMMACMTYVYVISSNMAIYGNDEKPGQHCIGSMESAQESCSEMPDAKIIMRRRGCSGC